MRNLPSLVTVCDISSLPFLHRSHNATPLLSTRLLPLVAFALWLGLRFSCSVSLCLSSLSRSLSFATIIWTAPSSWLQRSEICLSRASNSGLGFSPFSPSNRVLTVSLFFRSFSSTVNSVPFFPTCPGLYPASTFSHLWSLHLSFKQCFHPVMTLWALLALRCWDCWGTRPSHRFASRSCLQSWLWATLCCLALLVICGYQPDPCFLLNWIWHPSSWHATQLMESCGTCLLDEPESCGLVGVALRATYRALSPCLC